EADADKGSVDVQFQGWIEGYQDQGGMAEMTRRIRVWQYKWPRFRLELRQTASVAPSNIIARVRPVGFSGKLEDPVYEWNLPGSAIIEDERSGIVRSFTLKEAGTYQLRVAVRDARGNETVLEETVALEEAIPYEIEMTYSGSNAYDRAPLEVLLRPVIRGGHPRDRVEEREYRLNGELLESRGHYGRATLPAGTHELSLTIRTQMGQEATGSFSITVAENQVPVCGIGMRETDSSWIFTADCEDMDGRIRGHEWTLNGEKLGLSSNRISVGKGRYETRPVVTLVGIDDASGRSPEVTFH